MKKWKKQIVRLATKEALLSVFDLITPFFQADRHYRQSMDKYLAERTIDRAQFFDRIRYWQRKGYIENFVESKERYIELTKKGIALLEEIEIENIEIKKPQNWDGKWRIVIFDIPESQRRNRDILRCKLKQMGFLQIQKSVYVFPFKCTQEIHELVSRLSIEKSVIISVSEIIEGEKKIIEKFLKIGLLKKSHLKNKFKKYKKSETYSRS